MQSFPHSLESWVAWKMELNTQGLVSASTYIFRAGYDDDALRLTPSTESIHVCFVVQSKGQLTAAHAELPEAQPESCSQGRLRVSAWVHTVGPRQAVSVGLCVASRFTPLSSTESRICSCASEVFHIK